MQIQQKVIQISVLFPLSSNKYNATFIVQK